MPYSVAKTCWDGVVFCETISVQHAHVLLLLRLCAQMLRCLSTPCTQLYLSALAALFCAGPLVFMTCLHRKLQRGSPAALKT